MVECRTDTKEMEKTFLLASTLNTLSTETGMFCQIDCVQICCHRKGTTHGFELSHGILQ